MNIFKKLEDTFAAAAFAEAGEFETAREMAGKCASKASEPASSNDSLMTKHPSKA